MRLHLISKSTRRDASSRCLDALEYGSAKRFQKKVFRTTCRVKRKILSTLPRKTNPDNCDFAENTLFLFIVVDKTKHNCCLLAIDSQASIGSWEQVMNSTEKKIEVANAEGPQLVAKLLLLLAVVAYTQLQIHIKAVFLIHSTCRLGKWSN